MRSGPRHRVPDESARRSIRKALDYGSAEVLRWRRRKGGPGLEPSRWLLKMAGNCSAPVLLERDGYPLLKRGKSAYEVGGTSGTRPHLTDLEAPCRKCENCLKRRAAHWRLRAYSEYRAAERTWFGTLTVAPEHRLRVLAACRAVASRNGDDFDMLPLAKQFREKVKCISREVTRYLKRVRNGHPGMRFLLVVEAHKNGDPHFHVLVHEVAGDPIRHAKLSDQWRIGFSNWKLVADSKSAAYVTKYLAKSNLARVRASIDYGNPPSRNSDSVSQRPTESVSKLRESAISPLADDQSAVGGRAGFRARPDSVATRKGAPFVRLGASPAPHLLTVQQENSENA